MSLIRNANQSLPTWTGIPWMVASGLALLIAAPSEGQVLQGYVIDERSEAPISGAEVQLLDAAGDTVRQTRTDHVGAFAVGTRRNGIHRLRVSRLGYEPVVTEPLDLASDSVLHVVVRMAPDALPLEPLEVTARRASHLNRATYEGLYERWARSPAVGSNRVLLPTDRDFQGSWTVRDLLRNKNLVPNRPSTSLRADVGCLIVVYWGAQQVRDPYWAEDLLDTPTGEVEGVEIYNHLDSAPLPFRPVLDTTEVMPCAAVVIWPERMGGRPW